MLEPALEEFLRRLVEAIEERNSNYTESVGYINSDSSNKLDAPFIISSLYQKFRTDPSKFDDFIEQLEEYPDYEICIDNATSEVDEGLFAIARVTFRYSTLENPPYYQIKFYYDKRYLGYCECTPDTPDYREDKHCCGHTCDATFCSFKLEEVLYVIDGCWFGDEHDYWDFEDDFYEESTKRRDEKEREERRGAIEVLRRLIAEDTERLNRLLEKEAEFELNEKSGEGA